MSIWRSSHARHMRIAQARGLALAHGTTGRTSSHYSLTRGKNDRENTLFAGWRFARVWWAGFCWLALGCLLLAACGGGGGSSNQTRGQQGIKPTATANAGGQLLAQTAKLLNEAHTLHGLFNATTSGQLVSGEVDSEVWRLAPAKSRTLIQKSTLNQFSSGTLTVDDGKQIWQYLPAQKLVYRGPVGSSTPTTTPGSNANQNNIQQLLLGAVQMVFTQSTATLLSSKDRVNGHPVYTIQVVSQQNQGGNSTTGGLSFSYSGTVSLDQQSKLPLALDLNIPGFAEIQIAIPLLELNKTLASDLFTFTPPAGVKVQPFPTNTGQNGGSLTLQQAEQQAGYHILSIPTAQAAYRLQSIDALGAPGNKIYTLTYLFNGQTFTISQGKALANLPLSGQKLSLRGTTATLSTSGTTSTLSWTEKGIGIQITGPLNTEQIAAIAKLLS